MRHYLAIIGTSAASLVVCVAVFMAFMALRPAKADYFGLGIGGGTAHLHPGSSMPACNPTVSEECRRLLQAEKAKRPALRKPRAAR
jgi:hypothetical protein